MAKLWEMLDRANHLIGLKRHSEAQIILDEVLRIDPQNMEAWEAYMRMCRTQGDFEGLKNYIHLIWETRVREDDYLMAMQRFLLQRVDERMQGI